MGLEDLKFGDYYFDPRTKQLLCYTGSREPWSFFSYAFSDPVQWVKYQDAWVPGLRPATDMEVLACAARP